MGITLLYFSTSKAGTHHIWGTTLAVIPRQGFFYSILNMKHSAQVSMKAPQQKWYFQVSQIICSLSGTPWLNSLSRKGQIPNIPFTELERHIPISHKVDTFARPTVRTCQTRGFTHPVKERDTCPLPIWVIRLCKRNHPVHNTFSTGSIQGFL